MHSRSKSEIALAAGLSTATMNRWFRSHRAELQAMGVRPTQKLLTPRVTAYVCGELGIHEEDFVA